VELAGTFRIEGVHHLHTQGVPLCILVLNELHQRSERTLEGACLATLLIDAAYLVHADDWLDVQELSQ